MKVQTKIFLLLLGIVALFTGGLTLIRRQAHAHFRVVACERAKDQERLFNSFLDRQGEQLDTFARDSTLSDALITAIRNVDKTWIKQNILNDQTWARSNANAIWIYNPDRTLFDSANLLYNALNQGITLPPEAFDALEHQHLMYFFMTVPEGIMEVRAATIHPSADGWRRESPQGFLFAGRLWSSPVIEAFARDSDNFIRLLGPNALTNDADDVDNGLVAFTHTLSGWDKQPVARLLVRNGSQIIRELNQSSGQLLGLVVAFAVVLLVLLGASLIFWVGRPLRYISQTLETEQLAPVERLQRDRSEFGRLARLIRDFFGQRESLLAEIAERKHAQEALRQSGEQLRQAQKMEAVGRLAGGVAHDFNNLLTAILGYAELLAVRSDLDPGARQNVETIQKAGRQAAAVTHQLLAFSRKQILQPRVIDLNALIIDFEKILRRVIGEHIELSNGPHAANARVRADPNQLEQVILNLGVNARDAMPKGGQLSISTSNVAFTLAEARQQAADMEAGLYVLMEVGDTGHGMDEETQARIFEPFFTTKGPGKGTGLGLSTVYGVVKQSGGTICVDSTPGAGCTFRVYLPLETGDLEDSRPKTVAPVHKAPRQAETVLVVEDEEIVRELVCTVLSDSGYEVLCAPNGTEGLLMSDTHQGKIALMITDVVMPQMGGLELAREVTARRPETRVLYVSGYSEDDMSEQGILAADLEFLEKPFTPQALTRKVRAVLNPSVLLAGTDGA